MSGDATEMRLVRATGRGIWQLCWVQRHEGRWIVRGPVRLYAMTSNDNPDQLHLLKSLAMMHAAMGEALHESPIDADSGQEITLGEQAAEPEADDEKVVEDGP